jgi:hypothetical protein
METNREIDSFYRLIKDNLFDPDKYIIRLKPAGDYVELVKLVNNYTIAPFHILADRTATKYYLKNQNDQMFFGISLI